jgi:hypothetical protein
MQKIKGDQTSIGGSFRDFIPKELAEKDKTAFHLHTAEIERHAGMNFKNWGEWVAKRQIMANYCKRTGVNLRLLLHYAAGPYWKTIQHHLILIGKI